MKRLITIALIIGGICILFFIGIYVFGFITTDTKSANNCDPPNNDFSQEDLIGTWKAGGAERNDTLILKADGTYIQIIHIAFKNYDYKSEPQAWRLEYIREKNGNIPYLHLSSMKLCGFNPDLGCEKTGGTGIDFCQNKIIQMDNEGILIVLGKPEPLATSALGLSPSAGIDLWLPEGNENTWVYSFQGP